MKLSMIHEDYSDRASLKHALHFIYGHNGQPMGISRPKLHQPKNAASLERGNRAIGARQYDQGTPWKLRHRQFFRMSNDGAQGTIKY